MPLLAAAIPAALAIFGKKASPQAQPAGNSNATGLIVGVSVAVAAGIAGFLIYEAMINNRKRNKR